MSKIKFRKVSDFISEAKRGEFARAVADQRWPDNDSVADAYGKIGYIRGITEAMLTPEDIGTIFRISAEILASKSAEVQMGIEGDPKHYAEVLKRFNEIKFKK